MAEIDRTEMNQYLTFTLQNELFALDISVVREVLQWTHITKVPRTKSFRRGIINVRGNAVPVIDLNMRFGKTRTDKTVNSCIIIVEVELEGEATIIGAMADSVEEVYEIHPSKVAEAPNMGTSIDHVFIKGMAQHGNNFIMILNRDTVFSSQYDKVPGGNAA